MTTAPLSPLREVTEAARREARAILSTSRHAALACLATGTGAPLASRVAIATDITGDPLLLVSRLARHTGALFADPRASLLVGEAGRGDPLACPRLSVHGLAEHLPHDHPDRDRARRRFLARRPEAGLYVDFADFEFFRVRIAEAAFNGGFARAYVLERDDLCIEANLTIATAEVRVIEHMNADHGDIVDALAARALGRDAAGWRLVTLDARGFEAAGPAGDEADRLVRIEFAEPVTGSDGFRQAFVALVSAGRGS